MKQRQTAGSILIAFLAVIFMQTAAGATSSATPNPAVPGDEVTITYTDKLCASDWRNLASLNEGVLVVGWPDGTQTLVDPVTDPVVVSVPAGMQIGTANISLHKGFIGNGEYEACRGSFEIVEDATVPVVHFATIAGIGLAAAGGMWFVSKRRKNLLSSFGG